MSALRDPTKGIKYDHALKTAHEPFGALNNGTKTAEFRFNDRDFKCGHMLLLRETFGEHNDYTGRALLAVITHIQTGFGIPENYVMLSIQIIRRV